MHDHARALTRYRKANVRAVVAFAASSLLPASSFAQGNYRSTPSGGRSALLGDTGTALAADGAAPFLNPATIARIQDESLAFSVSFFSYSITSFSNYHQPGNVDGGRFGPLTADTSSESAGRFDALPSTLCLFFTVAGWGDPKDADISSGTRSLIAPKTGRQKLAVCLGSTEQEDVDIPAATFRGGAPGGTTHTAQALHQTFRRVHAGPSYGIDVTDNLTLGVSLHGVVSSFNTFWSAGAVTSDVSGRPVTTTFDATATGRSVDVDAIFGATYRFGQMTAGLALKPPSLHVGGTYDSALHQQGSAADGDTALLSTGTGRFRAALPARIGMGLGAELGDVTAEVDGTFYFPLDRAFGADVDVSETRVTSGAASFASHPLDNVLSARPKFDLAGGVEKFVSPRLSILGGLSTDLSSLPAVSAGPPGSAVHPMRINRVTLSGGLGSYGTAGTLLVGLRLSMGWGQALAVNPYAVPNDFAVVDARSYGAMLVFAGATTFRALRGVVESVKEVVEKP